MAKLNLSNKEKKTDKLVSLTLVILGSLLIRDISGAEITKRSDDIILAKGKLIMRGGKGKGKWRDLDLLNNSRPGSFLVEPLINLISQVTSFWTLEPSQASIICPL